MSDVNNSDHTEKERPAQPKNEVWRPEAEQRWHSLGAADYISATALSPDGKTGLVLRARQKVWRWDLTRKPATSEVILRVADGRRNRLVFSADSRLALLRSGRLVYVFNTNDGQLVSRFEHAMDAIALMFPMTMRGHHELVTVGEGNTLVIWELQTGRRLAAVKAPTERKGASHADLTFAQAANEVVGLLGEQVFTWSGSADAPTIPLAERGALGGRPTALACASDFVFVGTDVGTVAQVSLSQRKVTAIFEGHSDAVRGIIATPDGQFCATVDGKSQVRLWTVTAARCLATDHLPMSASALGLSPDG